MICLLETAFSCPNFPPACHFRPLWETDYSHDLHSGDRLLLPSLPAVSSCLQFLSSFVIARLHQHSLSSCFFLKTRIAELKSPAFLWAGVSCTYLECPMFCLTPYSYVASESPQLLHVYIDWSRRHPHSFRSCSQSVRSLNLQDFFNLVAFKRRNRYRKKKN